MSDLKQILLPSKLRLLAGDSYWQTLGSGLLVHIFFYQATSPGIVTPDSLWQYSQAQTQEFSDTHLPIMGFVWNFLETILETKSALLILHLAISFVAGSIFYSVFREKRFSFFLVLMPLLPWIGNFSGVLWKDVFMANFLLLASSLLFTKFTNKRFVVFLIVVAVASASRHNAIFAATPLLLGALLFWVPRKNWKVALRYWLGYMAIPASLYILFTSVLVNQPPEYSVNHVLVDDLSAISLQKNESLIPGVAIEEIRSCRNVTVFGMKSSGYIRCLNGWQPGDGNVWLREKSLLPEWTKAVTSDLPIYLSYRTDVFLEFLRFGSPPYFILASTHRGEEMGLGFSRNTIWWSFESYVKMASTLLPILFIPGTWLIIGIVLTLGLAFKLRGRGPLESTGGSLGPKLAMSLSAIFYISSYFFAVTGADFRFVYWSVVALSFLSAIELISRAPTVRSRISKRQESEDKANSGRRGVASPDGPANV